MKHRVVRFFAVLSFLVVTLSLSSQLVFKAWASETSYSLVQSSPLGIEFTVPEGWILNEYANVGYGYSLLSPSRTFDENGYLQSGAIITFASSSDLQEQDNADVLHPQREQLVVDGRQATIHKRTSSTNASMLVAEIVDSDGFFRVTLLYNESDPNWEAYIGVHRDLLFSLRFIDRAGNLPTKTFNLDSVQHEALAFPFAAGEEWKISSGGGYNNSDKHEDPGFLYALDFQLKSGDSGGRLALAPTSGQLSHKESGAPKCIDVSIGEVSSSYDLYLQLCHIDFESYLGDGSQLDKGQLLGTLATNGCGNTCTTRHVHIAAFIGRKGNPWVDPTSMTAIPFVSEYNLALDGHTFPPNGSTNQYGNSCCYVSSQPPYCPVPDANTSSTMAPTDICNPGGTDDTTHPSANGFSASVSDGRYAEIATSGVQDNNGGSGVREVRFSAKWDGNWHPIGEDSSAPYTLSWDMCSSNVPNGDVELGMEVWDNADNYWVWSNNHGNPHVTKDSACGGSGDPQEGDWWHSQFWMNKYLAGYVNWEVDWLWDNGNWPYILFDWGINGPKEGWSGDEFSLRIWRDVYFPGGHYEFRTDSDDGVKVYVGNSIVVDHWWDAGSAAGGRYIPEG